jgi:hypothetical protein
MRLAPENVQWDTDSSMKTFEFQARITGEGTLKVPEEAVAELPREKIVRVILLLSDSEGDRTWTHLAAERFLKGYAERDAVYDNLPNR